MIVWSSEPETILVPSLLKATERIRSLCALCFSALSSRDPVASGEVLRFDEIGAGVRVDTCIPDFERRGVASGDDPLPIWIELHRTDRLGIRVLDLGEFA